MAQHKPGSLKQKNKKHKGKDGKRAQNKTMGAGKTNRVRKSAKVATGSNKADRLNRNNQLKKQKRDAIWLQRRTGATDSAHVATKIMGILPLSDSADARAILRECFRQLNCDLDETDPRKTVYQAFDAVERTHVTVVVPPTGLERDLFFALELAKAVDVLIFAVNSNAEMIDETGVSALSALKAVGCPDVLFCVDAASSSMDMGHAAARKNAGSAAARKAVHQQLEGLSALPNVRCVDIDSSCSSGSAGGNMLARTLRNLAPKPVVWRAQRSYLLADAASVKVHRTAAGTCTVQLEGYLRGRPMNIHSLMHVVGAGAGRVTKVWQGRRPGARLSADHSPQVVVADSSRQEPLELEAAGNSLMGEQTWPTEEELMMAGEPGEGDGAGADRSAGRDRRAVAADAQLPKGMSTYQADWFMDEEGQLDFKGSASGGNGTAGTAGNTEGDGGDGSSIGDDLGDELLTLGGNTMSGKKSVAGAGYNSKGVAYTLKERQELDEAFPDEMDTPDDISARLRFARYRALQSFRASPWHPKENLPQDYARIFQFENFAGTQRRLLVESKAAEQAQQLAVLTARKDARVALSGNASVMGASVAQKTGGAGTTEGMDEDMEGSDDEGSDDEGSEMEEAEGEGEAQGLQPQGAEADGFLVPGMEDFVQTGQYIGLEVEGVAEAVAQRLEQYGFLLGYSLYAHEQKLSVLHFHVTKHPAYTEPIKSKDELLFVTGFRSFLTKPVFSESNLNCDKHKFERFLLPDRFSMASCYGPACVSSCPLLVFKRSAYAGQETGFRGACGGGWSLVATGSLANVEPDRIMLKKIVLTGFPIRVRKRFAVVKHLFHEPQDVRWFKPAELVTKWGLRGHITEPVGTHGLLKALFNGAIKQNDTVMLILYKRVYPKFPAAGLQLQ